MEDVDDLRAGLDEATEQALELADELAAVIASHDRSRLPDAARLAANYMQTRTLIRRLRRALTVVVAG